MTTSTLPRWPNDTELSIVLDIAKNLIRHQKNITVFLLAPHQKESKIEEIIDNIKIYRFRYFISRWEKLCYNGGMMSNIKKNKALFFLVPFFIFFQILAIKKIVKKEKIDLIHAHWLLPQGLAAVLYKKIFNKNIKIICTTHGSDIFSLNNKYLNFLKGYLLKKIDIITAVSNTLKEKIIDLKINPLKIYVIYNAIDPNFFNSGSYNKIRELKKKYAIFSFCLLFIGRLIKNKGIKYLIEAMPMVLVKFPETKLLIVGDGEESYFLKKIVKKLNLQNNISFLGKINHNRLSPFYIMSDILINPSLSEGFSLVLIEALVCGTAVIATNVGGISDIIKNNQTGLLIPPADTEAIAKTIIDLLSNKYKRYLLAKNGRNFVLQNFNWKKITKDYIFIYNKLLNSYNQNI